MNNLDLNTLTNITGRGIKIGLIDSGIDFNQPIFSNQNPQGVNLSVENKCVVKNQDFHDENGHGTSVAGIIKSKAKNSETYSIKILDKNLQSRSLLLAHAIDWSIENGMNIINISLGTTNEKYVDLLKTVCEKASKRNILIVSALPNNSNSGYPACFKEVLAVQSGKFDNGWDFIYRKDSNIWIAKGDPQLVYGMNSDMLFVGGTSMATPHLTGIIACMLEKYPSANKELIMELLIKSAYKPSGFELTRILEFREVDYSITRQEINKIINLYSHELAMVIKTIEKIARTKENEIKPSDNLFADRRIRPNYFYKIAKSLEKQSDIDFSQNDFCAETFFTPCNLTKIVIEKIRSREVQSVC
jgi:hypothetical protein